jgi:hypothetical protein
MLQKYLDNMTNYAETNYAGSVVASEPELEHENGLGNKPEKLISSKAKIPDLDLTNDSDSETLGEQQHGTGNYDANRVSSIEPNIKFPSRSQVIGTINYNFWPNSGYPFKKDDTVVILGDLRNPIWRVSYNNQIWAVDKRYVDLEKPRDHDITGTINSNFWPNSGYPFRKDDTVLIVGDQGSSFWKVSYKGQIWAVSKQYVDFVAHRNA